MLKRMFQIQPRKTPVGKGNMNNIISKKRNVCMCLNCCRNLFSKLGRGVVGDSISKYIIIRGLK